MNRRSGINFRCINVFEIYELLLIKIRIRTPALERLSGLGGGTDRNKVICYFARRQAWRNKYHINLGGVTSDAWRNKHIKQCSWPAPAAHTNTSERNIVNSAY
jgi:hypothetical protein